MIASVLRLFYAAWVLGPPAWRFRSGDKKAGVQLAQALKRLGPAYIKLGQMLATRPDIVGGDVARALEHLQDRLPHFSEREARQVIAQSFARPVEELFSVFGAPVAAASLAQVHRAVTSEGAAAAVKVLRPGIEQRFGRDLAALALFARVAENVSAGGAALRFIGFALVQTLAAPRWRWKLWICGWKPPPPPNSMTAPAAIPNSGGAACRLGSHFGAGADSPANGSTARRSATPQRSPPPATIPRSSP